MRWEELGEALDVLETEDSYGGYFYDIKDAVITAILGSLCELQSVKKIHTWAMSAPERTFLAEHFSIYTHSVLLAAFQPSCDDKKRMGVSKRRQPF